MLCHAATCHAALCHAMPKNNNTMLSQAIAVPPRLQIKPFSPLRRRDFQAGASNDSRPGGALCALGGHGALPRALAGGAVGPAAGGHGGATPRLAPRSLLCFYLPAIVLLCFTCCCGTCIMDYASASPVCAAAGAAAGGGSGLSCQIPWASARSPCGTLAARCLRMAPAGANHQCQ